MKALIAINKLTFTLLNSNYFTLIQFYENFFLSTKTFLSQRTIWKKVCPENFWNQDTSLISSILGLNFISFDKGNLILFTFQINEAKIFLAHWKYLITLGKSGIFKVYQRKKY